MKLAPIPKNEKERLLSLHELGLLDTEPEKRFDRITNTATKIFNVPISTLTLVDANREWFKSCVGLPVKEGERAVSFCGHALLADKIFIIPDTTKDKRFSDNPMVIGKPFIRFYAGIPIESADGRRVGVFCIKDIKPREFSKNDADLLQGLASWAETEINSRNLGLTLQKEKKILTKLEFYAHDLENANTASQNLLEDLNIEKLKVETAQAKDEAILSSIGDGIIAIGPDRKIIIMNKAAEKLLGWKTRETTGKLYDDVISLEDQKGIFIRPEERPLTKALTHSMVTTTVGLYILNKNKIKFPVAITVSPIVLDRKIIGAVEVFRDITKEQEIDKAKTEFVSLASHQLRTPLTAINWYVEMLQSGDAGRLNKKQKKYLSEIYQGSARMVRLVNDLLNISRIETGRLKIEPESIEIVSFIEDIIHEIEPWSKTLRREIVFKIPEVPLGVVVADKTLMRQVIHNMITNAVRYSPDSPDGIDVSLSKKNGDCLVSVADKGIGIPLEVQDKIFQKFFRADNARAVEGEGSGIGMYISKSIVDKTGGKLWFDSPTAFKKVRGEQVGYGTTFHLSIPISGMKMRQEEQGPI